MSENQQLLIENAHVIATFDDKETEWQGADILIEGPAIRDIGKNLREKHQLSPNTPVIDASSHLILPGLVNTHHHLFQVLTRCWPDVQNAELFHWLTRQYPHFANITEEDAYVAAKVGLAELLLTGCTTSSDHHYLYPVAQSVNMLDATIRASQELGIRFHPTRGSMTLGEDDGGLPPMSVIEKDERVLEDYERVLSQYHDTSDYAMLRIALAPCSPFNSTEFLLRETPKIARRHGVLFHTHLAETDDEDEYCLERYGKRPYDYVADLGWEGPDVWFAHCVKLNEEEIRRMAESGTGMSHCPSANCRLGSGIAPIPEMLEAGVKVSIGVDGSASNDGGDILGETRLAFLLHRANEGVEALTARQALKVATRGGADVLNNRKIGRLEVGSAADLIMLDLNHVAFAGGASLDPVAAAVMASVSRTLDYSIINGKIVVENGQVCALRNTPLVQTATSITGRLLGREESVNH